MQLVMSFRLLNPIRGKKSRKKKQLTVRKTRPANRIVWSLYILCTTTPHLEPLVLNIETEKEICIPCLQVTSPIRSRLPPRNMVHRQCIHWQVSCYRPTTSRAITMSAKVDEIKEDFLRLSRVQLYSQLGTVPAI